MASKNCKFKSFFECYGHFPLQNRHAVDQVPLELNRRDWTLEVRGTTDPVHIRGPKKDLDKRQATIQVCVRVEGEQIVKPTLIFRNANPAENRYEMPPGLRNRKVHFDGRTGPESSFYDERVDVMWQEKAWADEHVSLQYLQNFNQQVMHLCGPPKPNGVRSPKIALQLDNLNTQNTPLIRKFCWNNDIYILNTPENCTDVRTLVDRHLGKRIKGYMRDLFWKEYESSEEKCNFWTSDAKEHHWRIMYTRWLAEAWGKFCEDQKFILQCAREVGYANCRCGCENHYMKLDRISKYVPPSKSDPRMEALSKEEAKTMALAERLMRKEVRRQERIKRKKKAMKRRAKKNSKS